MKDRKTYKILTYTGLLFPFGINRTYPGEPFLGRLLTLNYFFYGSFKDLFYMDRTFDEAMARRGFTNADIRNQQGN